MLESAPNTATSSVESCNVPSRAAADDRALGGGSSESLSAVAVLPHEDRCAYVAIPELALREKPAVTPEEVWDSFAKEFSPIENFFCCIQLVRPNRLRFWCPNPTVLEDVLSTGLTLRGHPLRMKPVVDRCWLTVTHLPYGLPEQAIQDFFAAYGEVKAVRFVQFRKVYTGTVKIHMVLQETVPTRIQILGHSGLVYHPGQARTCFNCGVIGHESKRCPEKKPPPPKPGEKPSGGKKKKSPKKSRGQTATVSGPPTSAPEVRPPGPASPNYEEEFPGLEPSGTSPPGKSASSVVPEDNLVQQSDPPVRGTDSTPSQEEAIPAAEESGSSKGTFGPLLPKDPDHSVASDNAKSSTATDRPVFGVRLSDPPTVQSAIKSTRNSRKRKPAPIPLGIGLACTRTNPTPTPVCTGAQPKPNAGTDPSDPPLIAFSS